MNIVIDGLNLQLSYTTGIGTYARELSKILTENGHEIYPLYAYDKISNDPNIAWSHIIQNLSHSAPDKKTIFQSLLQYGRYGLSHYFFPLKANEIQADPHVNITAVANKLPPCNRLLNLSNFKSTCAAYGSFGHHPISVTLPKHLNIDLIHMTYPIPIRVKKVTNVLTIHDIIPIVLPHSTQDNLQRYRHLLNTTIKHADIVFTVSEHSKHDILNYFDVPEEKLHVTYQTVNIPPAYRELDKETVSLFLERSFGLNYKEYFLFYGAIEPKKNVYRLLEAMTLVKTTYPIVIVGKDGWLYHDVNQFLQSLQQVPSTRDRVHRIPYVSFHQLMYLLSGARGLVFPSLYEGFGLPILEAMQMGCPIITSNTTSLPEVAGKAAIYVNPTSIEEISAAIDKLSSDDTLCQDLQRKGYQQADKFSPEKYLRNVEKGYKMARQLHSD